MSYFDDVRTIVVNRLIAQGVAGGNVNNSPAVPGKDDDLPAVNVYVLSGSGQNTAGNANEFNAKLDITVDCFETGSTDIELSANIAALVAAAMTAIFTDYVLAAKIKIASYDWVSDINIEGRHRLAGAQLKITGEYIVPYAFTYLNDLTTVDVTVKNEDGSTVTEIQLDPSE